MEGFISVLKIVYISFMVLLLFNLTIFVHEFGHYLLARWRGLKVEAFAVWFGPALWRRKIKGVEYILGSVPLGGYVKLPQLQWDDTIEGRSNVPKEELAPVHPINKLPTLFAGSFFNVLFAFFIATILWIVGIPVPESMLNTTLGYVPDDSIEYRAGLRTGDKIVSINNDKVNDWQEIRVDVALSTSSAVNVTVQRNGKLETFPIYPSKNSTFGVRELQVGPTTAVVLGNVGKDLPAYAAGLRPEDQVLVFDGIKVLSEQHFRKLITERGGKLCLIEVQRGRDKQTMTVTPAEDPATKQARIGIYGFKEEPTRLMHNDPLKQVASVVVQMMQTFNALFHHKESGVGVDDLSGPIGIVTVLWATMASDIRLALNMLVLLNVNLAVINLLPLPVLDGGHIVFTLLEWIRKRPLPQRVMEILQNSFVILLLAFVLYVSFNDVKRLPRLFGGAPRSSSGNAQPAPAAPAK